MGRIAGVTPEETRARLVDAAAAVFERKGYERATVAEIAREAGVTTGAIYTHYDGKADLLVDALRTHGERATGSLFPRSAEPDAAEVLVALGTRLERRGPDDSALLVEALLAARRDPQLRAVLAAALGEREARLATVVSEGQGAGSLRSDVPASVAARFALMLGLGSMLVRELDLPVTDDAAWARFIRGLIATLETPRCG